MTLEHAEELIKQLIKIREELSRPSRIFKPTVKKSSTGDWTATKYDISSRGATPEEACVNFDKKWIGK